MTANPPATGILDRRLPAAPPTGAPARDWTALRFLRADDEAETVTFRAPSASDPLTDHDITLHLLTGEVRCSPSCKARGLHWHDLAATEAWARHPIVLLVSQLTDTRLKAYGCKCKSMVAQHRAAGVPVLPADAVGLLAARTVWRQRDEDRARHAADLAEAHDSEVA